MSNLLKEAMAEAIQEKIKTDGDLDLSGQESKEREYPFKLLLRTAVTVNGTTYKELTFRSPIGGDWTKAQAKANKTDYEKKMDLLVDLAEVDGEVFEQLDHRDHIVCLEVANDFFTSYQMATFDVSSLLT